MFVVSSQIGGLSAGTADEPPMDLESIFFPPSAIAPSSQLPADEQNQLIADRVLIAALKVRNTCGRT